MEDEDVGEENVVLIDGNKRKSMTDHSNHSKSIIKLKSTTKFKMSIMKRLQSGNFSKRAPILLTLLILISRSYNSEAFSPNINQQPKFQASSSSSSSSSISSSLSPQISSSQQANHHNSPPPQQEPSLSINLIPVDQPIISERNKKIISTNDDTSRSSSLGDSAVESLNLLNTHLTNQHDSSLPETSTGGSSESSTAGTRNSLLSNDVADFIQESVVTTAHNEAADSQVGEKKHQHQQQVEDYIQQAVYQIPEQFYGSKHQQSKQHPFVERRFGLLKKHYGTPMTANYATSGHYMSDCERCLFGLGAGQQQSADLQQIDPPQPIAPILPPAPPPPPPTVIPAPQPTPSNNFGSQSFGPLKNKFFMKFPFFMKPISFGPAPEMSSPLYNFGSTETAPYWYQANQYQQQHHHQQPLVRPNAALYIRPAYNCIQATPPFIASGLNQHLSDVTTFNTGHHGGSSSGTLSPTKGGNNGHTKQSYPFQQQQQTTYSSSQY